MCLQNCGFKFAVMATGVKSHLRAEHIDKIKQFRGII